MQRSKGRTSVVGAAAVAAALALAACGQKGPLFLGTRAEAASSPAAGVPLPPPPVRP